MGKVVSYFDQESAMPKQTAIIYTSALLAITVIRNLYSHTWLLAVQAIALKIRISTNALLYRKLLSLSSSSLATVSGGKIVTLTTKDLSSLHDAIDMTIVLCTGMIQTCVMVFVLYKEIGVSAVVAAVLLIVVFPIQGTCGIFIMIGTEVGHVLCGFCFGNFLFFQAIWQH